MKFADSANQTLLLKLVTYNDFNKQVKKLFTFV